MSNFIKMNKKLLIYSSIIFLIFPIFGFQFLLSFFGNILLLLILIPILLFVILFLSLNSLKSNINQCPGCGNTIIGFNTNCPYCGTNVSVKKQRDSSIGNASHETIEVEAEEVQ